MSHIYLFISILCEHLSKVAYAEKKKKTPRYPVLYLGYVQMKTFTKQTSALRSFLRMCLHWECVCASPAP